MDNVPTVNGGALMIAKDDVNQCIDYFCDNNDYIIAYFNRKDCALQRGTFPIDELLIKPEEDPRYEWMEDGMLQNKKLYDRPTSILKMHHLIVPDYLIVTPTTTNTSTTATKTTTTTTTATTKTTTTRAATRATSITDSTTTRPLTPPSTDRGKN